MRDFNLGGKPWLEEPETFLRKAQGERKGSIVFAHGICHGAWCWTTTLEYFSNAGYDCYALSYRGHGQRADPIFKKLLKYKLCDYVDDLAAVVEAVTQETGDRPFLVGHSMGGAVVQAYIDDNSHKVSGAVLYASAPAKRMRIFETQAAHIASRRLKRSFMVALGMKLSVEKVNDSAFFNDRLDPDLCSLYASLLQPESLRVVFGLMGRGYSKRWKSVKCPVCIVGSSADEYFPEKMLLRTAETYGVDPASDRYKVFPGLCHDMMLDKGWEETAEYVLAFLRSAADSAMRGD